MMEVSSDNKKVNSDNIWWLHKTVYVGILHPFVNLFPPESFVSCNLLVEHEQFVLPATHNTKLQFRKKNMSDRKRQGDVGILSQKKMHDTMGFVNMVEKLI